MIRNVKGTFDYLPKEQQLRNRVTTVLTDVFERFGYQPIVTPTLCYYDVLASKYGGGAEILKEVYRLTDQGKRDLALRYDLTVPFAKLITLTKDLTMPFKRYEIGKVFRDGPVKVGRNREFIQCDVDVVGIKDVIVDAELISLYIIAFEKLDIEATVYYNNRKLMSGILEECGLQKEQIVPVITVIDKFKKLSKDEIQKEFILCGMSEEQIEKLYNIFHSGIDGIKKTYENTANENIKNGLKELETVENYLKELEIDTKCQIDPTLARGLDIYTGTVFEVFVKNSKMTSAIGGGGRYDNIITNFINDGTEYPAVGCSFGLDAICEVLKEKEKTLNISPIDVYIIPLNTQQEALKLAYQLRKEGVKVNMQYTERKLNKILNSLNKESVPYVIILGEDEVNNKKVTLKNMFEEKETEFALNDIQGMKQEILTSRKK